MKVITIFLISSYLFLAIAKIDNQQTNYEFPFEKIIWSYWHEDIQTAPLIIRIFGQQLKSQSQGAGFQFIVLNKQNAKNYIQNYEQIFVKVRNNSYQYGPRFDADLIRLILIQQHGGVWVDISSVFINGLTQLQNILNPKYHHLITNKFSPQPDIMLAYFTVNQNRLQQKIIINQQSTEKKQILFNQYPGYEIYFIAAKKNNQLIKTIRMTYSNFTQIRYEELIYKFVVEDIFMNTQDITNYLTGNMAISYILQSKQKQLDKNLTLFGDRKTSFQYYKLWNFHAQLGPYFMQREFKLNQHDLFILSQQEIIEKGASFFIVIKFYEVSRNYFSNKLLLLKDVFSTQKNSFQTFLLSKPKIDYCQGIHFIVQNSLIAKMFQKTSLFQKQGIKTITKQQYERWNNYCQNLKSRKSSNVYYFKRYLNDTLSLALPYDGRSKVNWILQSDKDINFSQMSNIWWRDNIFFIKMLIIISLFTIANIWPLKLFHRIIMRSSIIRLQSNIVNKQWLNGDKSFKGSFLQKEKSCFQNKMINWINPFKLNIETILSLLLIMNIVLYMFMDIFTGRNQPWTIFTALLFSYIGLILVQRQIFRDPIINCEKNISQTVFKSYTSAKKSQSNLYIQSWHKYLYYQLYLLINFISFYLMLYQLMHNKIYITFLSIIAGLIWPTLFKMVRIQTVKSRQKTQQNKTIQTIRNSMKLIIRLIDKNYNRAFVVSSFGLINLIPNIKYIPFKETYVLSFLIFYFIMTMTLLLLGYLITFLIHEKRLFDLLRLLLIIVIIIQSWKKGFYQDGILTIVGYSRITLMFRTYFYMTSLYFQIGMEVDVEIKDKSYCKIFLIKFLRYLMIPIAVVLFDSICNYHPTQISELIYYEAATFYIVSLVAEIHSIMIYRDLFLKKSFLKLGQILLNQRQNKNKIELCDGDNNEQLQNLIKSVDNPVL